MDPEIIQQFLKDIDHATGRVNDTLMKSARDEFRFHRKLDAIFSEVHMIRVESVMLGLFVIELKAHECEGALVEITQYRELIGNHFLPLTIKLGDLLAHVASVRYLIIKFTVLGSMPESISEKATILQRNFSAWQSTTSPLSDVIHIPN